MRTPFLHGISNRSQLPVRSGQGSASRNTAEPERWPAVEARLPSALGWALALALALLRIRSLNPRHDCMCACSSCGLNSLPHCLHAQFAKKKEMRE